MSRNCQSSDFSTDEKTDDPASAPALKAEELHAMVERYRAILAAVPDIIMETDTQKVYTWANQPGREFFGDDVIGHEASDYFVGEQDTYEVVAPLFLGSEDTIYVESWQRRHDGENRLLAWWCRTLKDETGRVIGNVATARDITERKQVEEKIRQLNASLEQRVQERTEELRRAVHLMAGREIRMAELKDVIRVLRGQLIQAGIEPMADDPLAEEMMTTGVAGENISAEERNK